MTKIKSINLISMAKFIGILYAFIGFIAGIIFASIGNLPNITEELGILASLGLLGIIVLPLIYGVIGFIGGIIIAAIYNLVASWIGGIEITTE